MIDDFIPVTIISFIRIQLNIDIYLKEVQNPFSVLYFFSLSMKLSKPIKNDTASRQPCHFFHCSILKRIDIQVNAVDNRQQQVRQADNQ